MKHWIKLLTTLTAAGLVAATAAAFALASAATSGTRVNIAKTHLGRILVDSKGITLYDFPPDKGKISVCYGACAALWPPLITHGKPVAGRGARASLLGTTKRKDGKLQATYGGHPLYYFVTDRKPGQTTGQGLNQFGGPWWVLSPVRLLGERLGNLVLAVAALGAIGIALGTLVSLLISEYMPLFGFMESGYRLAIVLTLVFDGLTTLFLGLFLLIVTPQLVAALTTERRTR